MSPPGTVAAVSVRGASHVRENRPNQDAAAHAREGEWCLLAVADGHGASPHYRSDRGAAFAVESVLSLLRDLLPGLAGEAPAGILSGLAGALVASWRGRVEADIRRQPVRERPGTASLAVYGATCIAAAIGPDRTLFLQLGDGDILAAKEGGEDVVRAVPADPRLVGPATWSLCGTDAESRVELRLFTAPHPLSRPDFVLAATDGLSKSYGRDEDFLAAARHLRGLCRTTPLDRVAADLEPWLAECSRLGSRDDMTVALFSALPVVGRSEGIEPRTLPATRNPPPPLAEALAEGEPRSTQDGRASFEAELRSAPQDEEGELSSPSWLAPRKAA